MIGHYTIYYAIFNWLIGTVSVLNALLSTTRGKATDYLSHPLERIKRECIKALIQVS